MFDLSLKHAALHLVETGRHTWHFATQARPTITALTGFFFLGLVPLEAESRAVINKLVKKGVLTQAEADELIAEETAEVAKTKAPVAATSKEGETTKLTLSAKVQTQFKFVATSDETTGQHSNKQGFELRRMDIAVEGRVGRSFRGVVDYRAETNAPTFSSSLQADAGFQVDKAFIEYDTDGYGLFLFGMKKSVFGYEEYTSSSYILTVERGVVNNYFAGNGASPFNLGLGERRMGLYYDTADTAKIQKEGGYKAGVGVTNDVRRRFDANSGNYAYYLNALGVWKTGGQTFFDLGINTTYTDTEANRKNNTPGSNQSFGVEPFVRVRHGAFTFLADTFWAKVEDGRTTSGTDTESASPIGVNLMASYLIADTFEPVVSFNYLDTDGRGVAAGDVIRNAHTFRPADRARSVYTGANWYITKSKSVKLSAGLEFARFDKPVQGSVAPVKTEVIGGRMQAQILF